MRVTENENAPSATTGGAIRRVPGGGWLRLLG